MRNDGGGEGWVKRGESMEELKALWEEAKELKNKSMKTLISNIKSSLNIYGTRRNIRMRESKRSYMGCVFKRVLKDE